MDLFTLIANLLCAASVSIMSPTLASTGTTASCASPVQVNAEFTSLMQPFEEPGEETKYDVIAFFNGDTNTILMRNDLGLQYSTEVLWHEYAHAWDLQKGTELNGYPSFFSETHTGFDVEQFARLQTLYLGVWPENEVFPDEYAYHDGFADDIKDMERAGWLITDDAN